jgi:hypothetical protein
MKRKRIQIFQKINNLHQVHQVHLRQVHQVHLRQNRQHHLQDHREDVREGQKSSLLSLRIRILSKESREKILMPGGILFKLLSRINQKNLTIQEEQ